MARSLSKPPLESLILGFLSESRSKVDFRRLKHHLGETLQLEAKVLKRVVSGLIQNGTLCYTFHFGRSFIEISYDRPRVVSNHVVIKSPRCSWPASAEQVVVSLYRGASFGGGDHPSTRLAIQLIDRLLHLPGLRCKKQSLRAVDIGTGSGILAIVAARLGVGQICGVDTDPCAIYEARDNIGLNGVEDRVNLIDKNLDDIDDGLYDLVFANLRLPTLYGLRDLLEELVPVDSALVFSGLKSDETKRIAEFYKKSGYFLFEESNQNGWGSVCLLRGALLDDTISCLPVY
jgi:ribosomal protein L11 methyltransferase